MKENECIKYAGVYKEVDEIIGTENMKKMFQRFRGQQILFPQKLYNKEYVEQYVWKHKHVETIGELSRHFELTERRIRQLIKQNK